MDAGPVSLRVSVEECRWPLVESLFASHEVAGLAVAVVREGEVASRGFGVRDVGTGARVTPETMFHLASVSKPFVATAIVSLAPLGTPASRCSTWMLRSSHGCLSSRWPTVEQGR